VDVGAELIQGMENAVAQIRGTKAARRSTVVRVRVPQQVNVLEIRQKIGMTQREFAARYGFSLKNVQNWEQGARQPGGAARVLLTVIDREPKAVQRALMARQPARRGVDGA
jgi:putative transcriptional regulator